MYREWFGFGLRYAENYTEWEKYGERYTQQDIQRKKITQWESTKSEEEIKWHLFSFCGQKLSQILKEIKY